MEEIQIAEAIEKALISQKTLSTIIEKHMRYTVKIFIINKITSQQFNQLELDRLIEKGKTAKGIEEMFQQIMKLAVDNSVVTEVVQ